MTKLACAVGRLLKKRGQTLSVAESCTGGLLAGCLTDAAGSSEYFLEAVVAYSDASKVRLLGVSRRSLERFGAVSEKVAQEMARGILKRSHTDFSISITGVAGPSGGSWKKPVGTVWIGIARKGSGRVWVRRFLFSGSRLQVRKKAVRQALDSLRRALRPSFLR
ncbi:MAG: nicotinamide-nucleotide amidohydrolase family protein [Elusimicrobia bacterium]|nr:nicotinamide-nucleotide amidohydrolase family protein [Elusimicrobiota bacterium]